MPNRVHSAFEERFGRTAEVAWAAPGRLNLIGEHTDYCGGLAMPFAIAQEAQVAVARRSGPEIRVFSAQRGAYETVRTDIVPGSVQDWARYVLGPVWALEQRGAKISGLDVLLDSDVPQGAGLSSSAALQCAVLRALCGLFAFPLSDLQLARCVQQVEAQFAGVPCGLLDPLASLCSRPNTALCIDFADGSLQPVALDFQSLGVQLWVIDTGTAHQLSDGQYAARRADCEQLAAALGVKLLSECGLSRLHAAQPSVTSTQFRRGLHVLSENQRVRAAVEAISQKDMPALGRLLCASHQSLRDHFEVTTAQLDLAAQVAVEHGAFGARMVGGGFGGSVLALCPADSDVLPKVVERAFAVQGFARPRVWQATAGPGARELDAPQAGASG